MHACMDTNALVEVSEQYILKRVLSWRRRCHTGRWGGGKTIISARKYTTERDTGGVTTERVSVRTPCASIKINPIVAGF